MQQDAPSALTTAVPEQRLAPKPGRWRTLLALAFGYFIDQGEAQAMSVLFPTLQDLWGLSYTNLGTIGHLMGQAGDLTNIGSVLEQEGNLAEAKESYQRALSLFEKMKAETEAEFVRQNIQRVEKKLQE